MENRRTNFGNKRSNPIQPRNPIQNQLSIPSISQQEYVTQNNSSNIITIIILLVIFIIILYIIYLYGEKIYKYFNDLFSEHTYILLESDERNTKDIEKIRCKSGCVKGKCEKNDVKDGCNEDNECNLCVDNQGGFYGTVSNTKDDNEKKLKEAEEEDIIQNNRIMELEEMIKGRNKQIDDLNKYIDYVNKNKDKINKQKIKEIYEEEEDNQFIVKKNYS